MKTLYKFVGTRAAVEAIAGGSLKFTKVSDLNDPAELVPVMNREAVLSSLALLLLALGACGTVPQRPDRLAASSYGCMKAVLEQKLPPHLPDDKAHCLASGRIARYCGIPESYLAGIGKELRDLLGPGDAEWKDLKSDWAGVECARHAEGDEALAECCMR